MNIIFFTVFAACACFVNGHYRFYNSLRILDDSLGNLDDSQEQNSTDCDCPGAAQDDTRNLDQVDNNDEDLVIFLTETSTSANKDAVREANRYFNYWPQIVIMKPMDTRIYWKTCSKPSSSDLIVASSAPVCFPSVNRPMPFNFANLLPQIPGAEKVTIHSSTTPTTEKVPNHSSTTPTTEKVTFHSTTTPTTVHSAKTYKPSVTTPITTQHPHHPEKKDPFLPDMEAREHEIKESEPAGIEASTESEPAGIEASTESEPAGIEASTQSPSNDSIPELPSTETSTELPHNEVSFESTNDPSAESDCTTPSNGKGDCISVYDCKVLLDLVHKPDRTSQEVDLLKKSQCGYIGSTPAVCCPRKVQPQPQGNCYTPDGKIGQCISLYSCPHIANMLKPPVPSENIAYVQRSKCEGTEQYSVCCGPPPDPNNNNEVVPSGNCAAEMSAFPPDPRTECCGVDSRVGNKIVGGNATTVDQYPWLVMIEYVQGTNTKLLCGGVLISGKYVLTAGHCVAGQVLTIGTPKRVRLGEYDISHEGPDCAAVEAGGEDCTEGVTRILIEKIIPHPEYNPVSPLKRNDIALLRLKDTAPFTDFIRPICLPTKDLTDPANTPNNFSLFAAGWGAVSDRKSYSNVKLHVDLPFVSQQKCQIPYTTPGRSVPLWKAQLCAGGVTGKDSCKGDSGGPLMYEDGRTYVVIGIVSFGPIPCGMDGVPGVYSKVWEYLGWIRSTIVP